MMFDSHQQTNNKPMKKISGLYKINISCRILSKHITLIISNAIITYII